MFFLKVSLASLNIDSAAGNAFLDTPRSCAPLTSVGFAHNEAIDIDEHNLLSTRTEDTETVCRNLQQEVFNEGRFKRCLIRGLSFRKAKYLGFTKLSNFNENFHQESIVFYTFLFTR